MALFLIIATHYGVWTDNIDISSLTHSAGSYINNHPTQTVINSVLPSPSSAPTSASSVPICPEPEPKKHLDLPSDYDVSTKEDQLCRDFYTEKYITDIATSPRSLLNNNGASQVTQFEVATHPSHRKLNGASPVYLLQGVHWDPQKLEFVAEANDTDIPKQPLPYGHTLPNFRYSPGLGVAGCMADTKRELIVYPGMWEGTYPNMWHRLLEIWQAKLSFDAASIAIDPATGKPFLTPEQLDYANVVLPSDAPGPWGDLWKIVTPSPHAGLPPKTLNPETCYDVLVPTVGWASPFWSALLTSTYEYCPRQTLMQAFVARVMAHYDVVPRPPEDIATRPGPPAITVIQRSSNRKFRDFEALLEKMHARHPKAPINVVDLALLPIKEQIQLAQNTDVWVAHHGAAQTYAMFMPRTAALVEILPPLFVARGFRWIARMRGLVSFVGRAMWQVEYEEKYDGKPRPSDWKPSRQDDSDANGWQTEEWVWITHDEILDLVDAAVLSQKERLNDLA